ncbi:methionyl-tRNA formyltransferase [Candidatus Parcubacteria bacterium]|nr:MAG: methionyl-tRNA formyltransferase [Candidatus Parcubacteria bacterium]
MRYVFFGTPTFAARVLGKLVAKDFSPVALVCNPDRPAGRKRTVTPPPTKQLIRKEKLEDKVLILQPEDVSSIVSRLAFSKPDFFVVVAYGKILPRSVLNIPAHGAIGVHPSLLPKYRGPSPIQSAILSGEERTGISLFRMDEEVDSGPVIARREIPVNGKDYPELEAALGDAAGEFLAELFPSILKGEIPYAPQNSREATYTAKFSLEDGFVDPADLDAAAGGGKPEIAAALERKIRALNPEPGVWTVKDGKRMKLLQSSLFGGRIRITKIQMEGKKPRTL